METIEIDLDANQTIDPIKSRETGILPTHQKATGVSPWSFTAKNCKIIYIRVDIYHTQQYDFGDSELRYFKLMAKLGNFLCL